MRSSPTLRATTKGYTLVKTTEQVDHNRSPERSPER
jgi:hypothetical protein